MLATGASNELHCDDDDLQQVEQVALMHIVAKFDRSLLRKVGKWRSVAKKKKGKKRTRGEKWFGFITD